MNKKKKNKIPNHEKWSLSYIENNYNYINELFGIGKFFITIEEMKLLERYIHDKLNPIWKPVIYKGEKTIFLVNQCGELFNIKTNSLVRDFPDKDGYRRITFNLDKNTGNLRIHRAVAEAFIHNPENKPFVNHINGKKDCNWVGNLEWVTAKENTQHAYRNGLIRINRGEDRSNYTEKQILEVIQLLMKGYGITSIHEMTGISKSIISNIYKYKSWRHLTIDKGIKFPKYLNARRYYPDFKSIPSSYIRKLIFENKTNQEIFKETKLEESENLHKIFNKIRKSRIGHLRYKIKNNSSNDDLKSLIHDITELRMAMTVSRKEYNSKA